MVRGSIASIGVVGVLVGDVALVQALYAGMDFTFEAGVALYGHHLLFGGVGRGQDEVVLQFREKSS